jgi:hypothetical protein
VVDDQGPPAVISQRIGRLLRTLALLHLMQVDETIVVDRVWVVVVGGGPSPPLFGFGQVLVAAPLLEQGRSERRSSTGARHPPLPPKW